jgi:MFS family permease
MRQGMVRDRATRTFSSLKIRNYRYFFAGQSLSLIGTWMQSITQSWLVFTMTHSGTDVGLITAVQTLPVLLLGPIGGTIADRFGKYRILFWTQGLAGVQAGVLAVLALTGNLRLWELFVIAGSLGVINMIDNPTRQTFIVEMVGRDQLVNAVTLNSVMVNVARAIGPAVAGLLIAGVGSGWCFLINAISFAFVLGGLKAIHHEELTTTPRALHTKGQLVEGFRYVAHRPLLRNALIMMALVGCLTYEFQTTIPLIAGNTFHGNSATYGFLTACMGVGAVIGGLVAAGRQGRSPRRMVNTLLAFSVALFAATLAPSLWFEAVALMFCGAGMVTFLALGNTTLQLESAPEMRGRVMSLWSVSFLGTTPIGGPLVGYVAGSLGARYGLGIGAATALLVGIFGLKTVRRPKASAPPTASAPPDTGASVTSDADPGKAREDRPQRLTPVARTA